MRIITMLNLYKLVSLTGKKVIEESGELAIKASTNTLKQGL